MDSTGHPSFLCKECKVWSSTKRSRNYAQKCDKCIMLRRCPTCLLQQAIAKEMSSMYFAQAKKERTNEERRRVKMKGMNCKKGDFYAREQFSKAAAYAHGVGYAVMAFLYKPSQKIHIIREGLRDVSEIDAFEKGITSAMKTGYLTTAAASSATSTSISPVLPSSFPLVPSSLIPHVPSSLVRPDPSSSFPPVLSTYTSLVTTSAYTPPTTSVFMSPTTSVFVPPTTFDFTPPSTSAYTPHATSAYTPHTTAAYTPPATSDFTPHTTSVIIPPTTSAYTPHTTAAYTSHTTAAHTPPATSLASSDVPPPMCPQTEEHFPLQIISKKKKKSRVLYRVRWKGWDEKDDTWEPKSHIGHTAAFAEYLEMGKHKKN